MKWRSEDRPCPICGELERPGRLLGFRGGSAHRLGLGVRTAVVRCPRCHAVHQRPTLLPEGNPYSELTPSEYFDGHDSNYKIGSGRRLAEAAETLVGTRGRMLELGCGRGELLHGAAERGWSVAGVDMTPDYVENARRNFGLEIEEAAVEACRSLDEGWDVVILAAVLEHVYDPIALLRRVSAALRPGGVIYLDVPNECSLYTRLGNLYLRLRGRDWALNLSPTFSPFHVVGFCPASLRFALEATGFEVVSIRLYAMTAPPVGTTEGLGSRLQRALLTTTLWFGHAVGQGAGINCWAKKPEPQGKGAESH